MAGVKIGLDFGTHFTKICVENSSEKRNRRYSFHNFSGLNEEPSFVFPSVVQLNKDNTLSYGFVDTNNAKLVEGLPEKNAPQKPSEPEFHSYKQFPEIIKPERDQFFSDEDTEEQNEEESNISIGGVQFECISLFNTLYQEKTWENVRPVFVKTVIKNFTLADIKTAASENGDIDIRALVDLAVSRSNIEGPALLMGSAKGVEVIRTQCVGLYKSLCKKHVWKNVYPAYVLAVIDNFTAEDVKDFIAENGEPDIRGLVNKAVSLSSSIGRELFLFAPTSKSNKWKKKKRKKVVQPQKLNAQQLYAKALSDYEKKCVQRERDIDLDKKQVDAYNERLRMEYERQMELWKEYERTKDALIPATFRSFKQMVFSEGFDWRFEIDPMLVSIWYLCYVFFGLDQKYETRNLIVCMGTSSGQNNWRQNKEKATQIILTVYDLIENVFNHNRDEFLKCTLDELISKTKIKEFSQEAKDANMIYVFPEAFANLNPLAKQKRFGAGVNAVVDIGGGTTDISIFIAPPGNEVKIFDYSSIPYGVNAIEKRGLEGHFDSVNGKLKFFSRKIIYHAQSLGVKQVEAEAIVKRRPIVFTGGGSMRPELRKPYCGFTDVKHIGSALLKNYSIDDAVELTSKIPLLSTSLGLALCSRDDSKIPLISYKELFKFVEEAFVIDPSMLDEPEHAADYGLADY